MAALIHIDRPKGQPTSIELGGSAGIGRAVTNEIQILDDVLVSRRHALIRLQSDGTYYLVDLGSANGTELNSRRIDSAVPLRDQDIIQIGKTLLRFELPTESPVPTAEEPERGLERATMIGIRTVSAAILVCDLRDFTSLSETLSPEALARFVAHWFRAGTQIVTNSAGIVDCYIGDAILAYWPAPGHDLRSGVAHCLGAALQLVELARTFPVEECPDRQLRVGIGIHCGLISIGNVGSSSHRDSTIVGDPVNVTFRLEGLAKQLDLPIVISLEVSRAAPEGFSCVSLGRVTLKGKSSRLEVFGLKC